MTRPSPLAQSLAHAVTRYDRTQAAKRYYNPYALAIYLRRCDEVHKAVRKGASIDSAVRAGFTDRLRDSVLAYLAKLPPEALNLV